MTEVPKIVHQRLKAASAGNEHPDADLLTAFTEQGLSADERENVLAHLALCAGCREVIALALPEEVGVAAPAVIELEPLHGTGAPALHKPQRQRFAWVGLRWAALAAGVAVAAGVLLVNPGKLDKMLSPTAKAPAVAMVQPAPAPMNRATTDQTDAGANLVSGQAITDAPAPTSHSASEPSSPSRMKQASPSAEQDQYSTTGANRRDELLSKAASPSSMPADSKTAHAAPSIANSPLMARNTTAKKIFDKDQGDSASADGSPSTLPAESRDTEYAVRSGGASSETVEVSSAPALTLTDRPAPVVEKAKEVPPKLEANEEQPAKVATASKASGMLASSRGAAVPLTHTTWTITSGILQKSNDGGHNWQTSLRADHPLLCYATHGQEVWAGGQSGILYHSTNGGLSWTQIQPSSGGHPITTDVTHIDLTDVQIVITTSNGETWTSSDGGKMWEKK